MNDNPAADSQALAENYRQMYDEELERLGDEIDSLTDTAQQVLRTELKNRGLAEPGAPRKAATRPDVPAGTRWASSVGPGAGGDQPGEPEGGEGDDRPSEFTWKTPLCECEDETQAWQLHAALAATGIESWIERPGSRHPVVWDERMVGNVQVLVAADQLEQAIEMANRPIPQEIVEVSKIEVPEYVAPSCPACGAEDPVLESAEPTNSWLCEVCGKQWSDPVPEQENPDA
jgi:hypothetical protein